MRDLLNFIDHFIQEQTFQGRERDREREEREKERDRVVPVVFIYNMRYTYNMISNRKLFQRTHFFFPHSPQSERM